MNLVSMRFITADIQRLVSFYGEITGLRPTWYTDDFAELTTRHGTLAIGTTRTMQLFGTTAANAAAGGAAIIEFYVEDVDEKFEELKSTISDFVQPPTTMPWGNRSLLFRDPDGNLVNFFTPITPQAIAKFQSQAR